MAHCHGRMLASDNGRYTPYLCYLQPLPVWVCMSI